MPQTGYTTLIAVDKNTYEKLKNNNEKGNLPNVKSLKVDQLNFNTAQQVGANYYKSQELKKKSDKSKATIEPANESANESDELVPGLVPGETTLQDIVDNIDAANVRARTHDFLIPTPPDNEANFNPPYASTEINDDTADETGEQDLSWHDAVSSVSVPNTRDANTSAIPIDVPRTENANTSAFAPNLRDANTSAFNPVTKRSIGTMPTLFSVKDAATEMPTPVMQDKGVSANPSMRHVSISVRPMTEDATTSVNQPFLQDKATSTNVPAKKITPPSKDQSTNTSTPATGEKEKQQSVSINTTQSGQEFVPASLHTPDVSTSSLKLHDQTLPNANFRIRDLVDEARSIDDFPTTSFDTSTQNGDEEEILSGNLDGRKKKMFKVNDKWIRKPLRNSTLLEAVDMESEPIPRVLEKVESNLRQISDLATNEEQLPMLGPTKPIHKRIEILRNDLSSADPVTKFSEEKVLTGNTDNNSKSQTSDVEIKDAMQNMETMLDNFRKNGNRVMSLKLSRVKPEMYQKKKKIQVSQPQALENIVNALPFNNDKKKKKKINKIITKHNKNKELMVKLNKLTPSQLLGNKELTVQLKKLTPRQILQNKELAVPLQKILNSEDENMQETNKIMTKNKKGKKMVVKLRKLTPSQLLGNKELTVKLKKLTPSQILQNKELAIQLKRVANPEGEDIEETSKKPNKKRAREISFSHLVTKKTIPEKRGKFTETLNAKEKKEEKEENKKFTRKRLRNATFSHLVTKRKSPPVKKTKKTSK